MFFVENKMDKTSVVKLIIELNKLEIGENLEELLKDKVEHVLHSLNRSYETLSDESSLPLENEAEITNHHKYIVSNFHLLNLLNSLLSSRQDEILSVQETKNLRDSLKIVITIGILKNLQPNLPHYFQISLINSDYGLLKMATLVFIRCLKMQNLRMILVPHFLQGILVALYQLSYCPLRKPTDDSDETTQMNYLKWSNDQAIFTRELDKLRLEIHPIIFIKEIMLLFQANSPKWLKKAISSHLNDIMKSPRGVEHLTATILDGAEDDRAKTWKAIDVLARLITNSRTSQHFQNICYQLGDLLTVAKDTDLVIYERLYLACTKLLYSTDKELCGTVLIKRITNFFTNFTDMEYKFLDGADITSEIHQNVRLIHGAFVDKTVDLPCLPVKLLKPVINIIFCFIVMTNNTKFVEIHNSLNEILKKYFEYCSDDEMDALFDCFLFEIHEHDTDIKRFRNDIMIDVSSNLIITIKHADHVFLYNNIEAADIIYKNLQTEARVIFFGYLLKCIIDKDKYFKASNNDLLEFENTYRNISLERLLAIHKLLSEISTNKEIQSSLKNKPDIVINYMKNIITKYINTETHKSDQNPDFLNLFTIVMLLENLIENSSRSAQYSILKEDISKLSRETSDSELKHCCDKIMIMLNTPEIVIDSDEKLKTELDKALEDICDPVLPVRSHGLLALTKLVEKRDQNALERKQYIFNIFQMSLRDEDSYIYLNAVQGLVAMTNMFPDAVLEILCEEFLDGDKKDQLENRVEIRMKLGETLVRVTKLLDGDKKDQQDNRVEIRMKLGETLVRVTKLLGEMAPKYKSLLLNTFLVGARDDDHLIRASSLSNLSEVCRVLGYKLGTIITEVLSCVDAIIATDKSPEARRAAVTVLRQLFVGLSSETISFLKDEILDIYRNLKYVYANDHDDVMRLQAQLALEELNENVKTFMAANDQLNFHKKPIIM